ncbi:MAG: hypothetical protein WCQ72_02515 [Eubacteriales bacterium]
MNNSSYGTLIVNVKTARGAIPVEGATVTVSGLTPQEDGTSQRTIEYVLVTDSAGLTPKVQLEAYPRMQTPEGDEIPPPYKLYIIETSKDGFYSVENTNVPIYEDITSIQPVEMLPLADIPEGKRPRVIYNESGGPSL